MSVGGGGGGGVRGERDGRGDGSEREGRAREMEGGMGVREKGEQERWKGGWE